MEEPKKPCNDQGKKKISIQLGGGVGAVVLLATAAFASAFFVRRSKWRSSGRNHRRQGRNQSEKLQTGDGESNKGQQLVILDTSSDVCKEQRLESTEEVETENDRNQPPFMTESLVSPDGNLKIEMNGGTGTEGVVCDMEASHENVSSILKIQLNEENTAEENCDGLSGTCTEEEDVRVEGNTDDDGPRTEERKNETGVEITDAIPPRDEGSISEICLDKEESEIVSVEQTETEEKLGKKGDSDEELDECGGVVNGEIGEMEAEKVEIEEKELRTCDGDAYGEIVEEKQGEANGEKKQDAESSIDIHVGEAIEMEENEEIGEENGVTVDMEEEEDPLAKQEGTNAESNHSCSRENDLKLEAYEEMIPFDAADDYGDEETECAEDNPAIQNTQLFGYSHDVMEKYGGGDESVEIKDIGKEGLECNSHPINHSSITVFDKTGESGEEKDQDPSTLRNCDDDDDNDDEETDLSDEGGESSTAESSLESSSEEIWLAKSVLRESSPREQVKKLMEHELEGKIQEDTIKQGQNDLKLAEDQKSVQQMVALAEDRLWDSVNTKGKDNNDNDSRKTSVVDKYTINLGMAQEAHQKNSTMRTKMLIGMLSILSSLSCSWFFGISLVKICVLVFLTMALSQKAY